ncbi:DUF3017 domain-containing protein [Schaalia sp. ZJ1691]|uniref:DUF3017 domain-containing protein n=1 Tax=Schaalia sp. ZJ1691 TaxID=2709404 RepID=UPI001F14A541|nr:DUF3017 domain-containing protein [Schaalia sp. ZJ1691]
MKDDHRARVQERVTHWGTLLWVVGGVVTSVLFAALNHPHRAVLVLSWTLIGTALFRLLVPGRPWFASRNRWVDAIVYGFLGALLWYLAPYTATMGLG